MALPCGCDITAGAPISQELVKKHYKHTISALLFWELIHQKGQPQTDANLALSEARITLIDKIDALYPWASEE